MQIAQYLRGPGWLALHLAKFAWGTLPFQYLSDSKSYWNLDFDTGWSKYPIFAQTQKRLKEMHRESKHANLTQYDSTQDSTHNMLPQC